MEVVFGDFPFPSLMTLYWRPLGSVTTPGFLPVLRQEGFPFLCVDFPCRACAFHLLRREFLLECQ